VLKVVIACALLMMCVEATRLCYADWLERNETAEGFERAVGVVPQDAWSHLELALHLAYTAPARAQAEFSEAVRWNPRDSRSLIELGWKAESAGDYPRAERFLVEAARVDTQFFPKATLAIYYQRRGDKDRFWTWARSAIQMDPRNQSLFRLAAYVAGENAKVASLLNLDSEVGLASFLDFTIDSSRLGEVAEIAGALSRFGRREHQTRVLAACDFLIRSGRTGEALAVWRAASRGGLISYAAEEAEAGHVTNPEFRETPLGAGFDWRLPGQTAGVEVARLTAPAALRIRLTGDQPERCELIGQYLAVPGPAELVLTVSFRTTDLPHDSGFRWMVLNAASEAVIGKQENWLHTPEGTSGNTEWTEEQIRFQVSRGTAAVRIVLVYERAPGTVRAQGDIALNRVEVSSVASRVGAAVPHQEHHER
jgi:hypothetical protein